MRRVLTFLVAAAVLPAVWPATPAGAVAMWSGECSVTASVRYSPAVGTTQLQGATAAIELAGSCVLNSGADETVTLRSYIPMTAVFGAGLSCVAGGAINGFALVDIPTDPNFPGRDVSLRMANVGGTLTLVAEQEVAFDGVAELVPSSDTVNQCASGGVSVGTYTGQLVFQDPTF
ncbi:MAG TPA: hypothetical protein VF230_06895 [Acidimicrobiales bacterium]